MYNGKIFQIVSKQNILTFFLIQDRSWNYCYS